MDVMKKSHLIVFIFLLFSFVWAEADKNLPPKPTSWVNDYAGVLNENQQQELDRSLALLQQRSSNQIFIAIFNKMPEGEYLEDFAARLYKKWGLGLKNKDNGVLIVVFIRDRKIRLEVGYGLEDVITDAYAARIIRNKIAPYFKQGEYYKGLKSALDVLIPAVEKKYQIPIKSKRGTKNKEGALGTIITLIILFFIISRFFGGGTGIGTRRRSSLWWIAPFFLGGFGGGGSGSSGGGFGGGGFSGGFGGLSGGGGASGGW